VDKTVKLKGFKGKKKNYAPTEKAILAHFEMLPHKTLFLCQVVKEEKVHNPVPTSVAEFWGIRTIEDKEKST